MKSHKEWRKLWDERKELKTKKQYEKAEKDSRAAIDKQLFDTTPAFEREPELFLRSVLKNTVEDYFKCRDLKVEKRIIDKHVNAIRNKLVNEK